MVAMDAMVIAFDPAAYIRQRSASDPAFRDAYKALEDEYSTLDMLLRARKEAQACGKRLTHDRCGRVSPKPPKVTGGRNEA